MSSRFLFFLFLLAACNNASKQPSSAAAKPHIEHSPKFASSVDSTMDAYYKLTEAFVNWDSVSAQSAAGALQNRIGRLSTEVVPAEKNVPQANALALLRKVDGSLEQIRNMSDIGSQRRSFSDVTKNLFDFLAAVKWSYSSVYLQRCPMAFGGDNDSGYWLSPASEVRNPYLGLHHPGYGRAMLGCGDTDDSLKYYGSK